MRGGFRGDRGNRDNREFKEDREFRGNTEAAPDTKIDFKQMRARLTKNPQDRVILGVFSCLGD